MQFSKFKYDLSRILVEGKDDAKAEHIKKFEVDKQGLILHDSKSIIKIPISLKEFLVLN